MEGLQNAISAHSIVNDWNKGDMRSADAECAYKAWGRCSDGPAWKRHGEEAAEQRVGNVQQNINYWCKCSQAHLLTAVNKSKGDTGPCNGDADCSGRREPEVS